MVLQQKYLKILSGLLPAGAIGMVMALGAAAPAAADPEPMGAPLSAADQGRVADRLAAIRDAVSAVDGAGASKSEEQVAWWAWRNGGGGWRNGGGWGWRNGGGGGWGNGGWHNGGWRNYWRNF